MSESAVAVSPANEDDQDETTQTSGEAQGGVAPKVAPKQDAAAESKDVGGVAGERLRSFIERIERLEEEKAAFAEDIKEVYGEAKGVGFDAKTIRKVVGLRKLDTEKRREADELLDLYKSAIGMF